MTRSVLGEGRPVIFYIHPREIDPDHPRLPMNWKRRFKSYVNLKSTMPKIESLLSEFPMTSFARLIDTSQTGSATRTNLIEELQKMVPLPDARTHSMELVAEASERN